MIDFDDEASSDDRLLNRVKQVMTSLADMLAHYLSQSGLPGQEQLEAIKSNLRNTRIYDRMLMDVLETWQQLESDGDMTPRGALVLLEDLVKKAASARAQRRRSFMDPYAPSLDCLVFKVTSAWCIGFGVGTTLALILKHTLLRTG